VILIPWSSICRGLLSRIYSTFATASSPSRHFFFFADQLLTERMARTNGTTMDRPTGKGRWQGDEDDHSNC
jgi:hypothetical protein